MVGQGNPQKLHPQKPVDLPLLVATVIEADCIGCTKCARNCPVSCISGKVKEPHVIDQEKCIKCGACMANCPVGAISKG